MESSLLNWLPLILSALIAAGVFTYVVKARARAMRDLPPRSVLEHEIARLDMEKRLLELQLAATTRDANAVAVTRKSRSRRV